ncbi:MAG: hypothetical protein IJW05_12405 [Lentisphaeria bacterium]|nr:hypothetical protein [Lentisphaeria bacterium]
MKKMPDPIETIRAQAMKRIVDAGIFPLEQIQRENGRAPEELPYCRLTIPQAAEFDAFSQESMEKTIIIEFDVMTRAFGLTQSAGMIATSIENAFGMFDRGGTLRQIPMPGWNGIDVTVSKFGRGTAQVETEENIYYLSVLIYARITVQDGASYGAE